MQFYDFNFFVLRIFIEPERGSHRTPHQMGNFNFIYRILMAKTINSKNAKHLHFFFFLKYFCQLKRKCSSFIFGFVFRYLHYKFKMKNHKTQRRTHNFVFYFIYFVNIKDNNTIEYISAYSMNMLLYIERNLFNALLLYYFSKIFLSSLMRLANNRPHDRHKKLSHTCK